MHTGENEQGLRKILDMARLTSIAFWELILLLLLFSFFKRGR